MDGEAELASAWKEVLAGNLDSVRDAARTLRETSAVAPCEVTRLCVVAARQKSASSAKRFALVEEAVAGDPDNPVALMAMAHVLASAGDGQAATRAAVEAARCIAQDAPAITALSKSGADETARDVVRLADVFSVADEFQLYTAVVGGSVSPFVLAPFAEHFYRVVAAVPEAEAASANKARFAHDDNVRVVQGATTRLLPTILAGMDEPCLVYLDDRRGSDDAAEVVRSVLMHPIKNHVVVLRTRRVADEWASWLSTATTELGTDFPMQVRSIGDLVVIHISAALQHLHRTAVLSAPRSDFGSEPPSLASLFEADMRQLPLFVSYPRSGSNWLNCVMELYFDRPRLRADRITFMPGNRSDYMWGHDHDLTLDVRHGNTMYLYRDPVDVLYSYWVAERRPPDVPFVTWHSRALRRHLSKHLLSPERASVAIRYDRLRDQFEQEFEKVVRFFGADSVDAQRLSNALSLVSRESLAERGNAWNKGRYIGTHLLSPDYADGRSAFRDKHGAYIRDEVVVDELRPFFDDELFPATLFPDLRTRAGSANASAEAMAKSLWELVHQQREAPVVGTYNLAGHLRKVVAEAVRRLGGRLLDIPAAPAAGEDNDQLSLLIASDRGGQSGAPVDAVVREWSCCLSPKSTVALVSEWREMSTMIETVDVVFPESLFRRPPVYAAGVVYNVTGGGGLA